ncbi:amidase [Vibrio natriegens]|uniref:amidase n=1 Tax=Vibrio natriegens TaxID=691 RepID=UPI0008040B67|nr:amidase [Vibrio natriegens]ANQ23780.1 amidase [Vibrio natriegens]MCY9876927.1 amidase [Vibrio natriegens]
MAIERPTAEQLQQLASRLHMSLTKEQAEEYLVIMQANFDAYDLVDSLPDYMPEVKYPRGEGHFPTKEENPNNAWYYKTEVKGAPTGKLAGKTVVLKDNVSLAQTPMMNGSSSLEGHIPTYDATVVTRLLDAGATIVGKATCEHFCLSGGSHTSDPAAVHNPYKHGYSAGGSSSGSGALVGAGEVDMAIGCDQGGSIRIPASFCGAYGMKPTHGLVPYTGIMAIEATIDHAGPITQSVKDNALMLEVIAGADGLDPRQYAPKTDEYTNALDKGVKGLKIGVLTEGFALPNMDERVAEKVRKAIAKFEELGAIVSEVSIPAHGLAGALWSPIGCEGLTAQMMHGNAAGFNWEGLYDLPLLEKHSAWREQADALSPSLKVTMFVGQYGMEKYKGHYYAKAQNLSRMAKEQYNQVFSDFDLIVMPTLPIVAQPLPDEDCSIVEYITRAFEMIGNTAPLDITGNPAMTVPCGMIEGLPVGMMIVGRHYNESTIYQAAAAFESVGDWKEM